MTGTGANLDGATGTDTTPGTTAGGGDFGEFDPVPACGDGKVANDETCDTAIAEGEPGACPSACPTPDPCLPREPRGSACNVVCEFIPLECMDGDGCCPEGCSNSEDDDCSGSCGDGMVQADLGETCEREIPDAELDASSACPSECPDDGDACTMEVLAGSADNCNAVCTATVIDMLDDEDGCCPEGANNNIDADCKVECGNGVIEAGEQCEGGPDCDAQCLTRVPAEAERCMGVFDPPGDDENACTDCICVECSNAANDCFDSGDAVRDANCAELVYCGLAAGCRGSQCYCGLDVEPDATCIVGDGPCAALLDRVAGVPGALSVYNQQFDPSTAIGRGRAFSDCHGSACPAACAQ